MNESVTKHLIARGYKGAMAEKGVEGFLERWRYAVRILSGESCNWIIHDYWVELIRRAVLDELLPLLPEEERAQVASELEQLDDQFRRNTWPTLHKLNKASRATGKNAWRDFRLPKNIKLDEDVQAYIREAQAHEPKSDP